MTEIIPINNTEVVFELNDGQVFADSLSIAAAFGKLHKNVMRDIRKMPKDDFWRLNFEPGSYLDANNQKRTLYQITRDGFSMLVMGFTGQNAYKWKVQFIEAFNLMEQKLRGAATVPLLEVSPQIDGLHRRFGKLEKELDDIKGQFVHDAKERADIHLMLQQNTIHTSRLAEAFENMPLDTQQLSVLRKFCEAKGRDIAMEIGIRTESAIPAVFKEMNRHFGVSTYHEIKREDFERCIAYIGTITL